MKLAEIVNQLDAVAPPATAETWDNVGLLVGDPQTDVTRALLCIDYAAAVAEEGKSAGCELVLAYHPPIFKGLKRITSHGASAQVFDAIRRGVAIYSPHTALDVAEGGTNDVLADILGLTDRRPLRVSDPKVRECKLVTFAPTEHADKVAEALFAAGAGRIGNYSQCSFRTEGFGTFLGEEGTRPAVGQAGRLEKAVEIKIETVLPLANVSDAVAALKAAHPYETPAFDLVALTAPPTGSGIGRVGTLPPGTGRSSLVETLKTAIGIGHVLTAGSLSGHANTVAVCAGAGGEFLDDALAAKADVYVTGELRHHDALRATAAGMTVICTLHSNSERVTLRHLAKRLAEQMPGVAWLVSESDADPFVVR
jgi:dinuclear metal center YbgI/SA1388 family protein